MTRILLTIISMYCGTINAGIIVLTDSNDHFDCHGIYLYRHKKYDTNHIETSKQLLNSNVVKKT